MSTEEPGPSGASNYRETPNLGVRLQEEEEKNTEFCEDANREEDSTKAQRSSSSESEDSEPEPPPPSSLRRKVSFADAFGLDLVSVKEFDSRVETRPEGLERHLRLEAREGEEYYLSCLFTVPFSDEELSLLLQQNKLELESIELLPGSTTMRGIVRVLNLSYHKAIYIRITLDRWQSFFDLLAEYIPGSSDGQTDRFSFNLTLVPPFQAEGTRVEFCLRYESSAGIFWANKGGTNYVLFCHQRGGRELKEKDGEKETETEESNYKGKKSCLKASRKWSSAELKSTDFRGDLSEPESSRSGESEEEKTQRETESCSSEALEASCKVLAERRNRRRAARLARVQDYFSQKETEIQLGGQAHWKTPERLLKVALPAPQLSIPVRLTEKVHTEKDHDTPPILTYHQIPLPSLDWGKHTSYPAHSHAQICSAMSPDATEKQLTEKESTWSSTDAWKTFLKETDSSNTHDSVVDHECLQFITLLSSHTDHDVSSPQENVPSVCGEIRNSLESLQTNRSHGYLTPEEILESGPAERWQDLNPSHAKEEALGYKYSEQPRTNSETHNAQESELILTQPWSETQDGHISSQTSFSEDAHLAHTSLLETVDAIESQDYQGGHEVLLEECAGNPDSSGTQKKVKEDIDETAVDTLTFTGIRDEPFTDRHVGSKGFSKRQHIDEEKEPKQVKERIRKDIENGAQMKAETTRSEYPEDLIKGLEGRRHGGNEDPSHLRDQRTEIISMSKNVMFDEGELDARIEWSDREASKQQGEEQEVCHAPEKAHAEMCEEIPSVAVDTDRECEIRSTTKLEGQEEPSEVDEVIHGRMRENEAWKDFIKGKKSYTSCTTDTCLLTHNPSRTSHASESSQPFCWTESVIEGEPIFFSGTYKDFEIQETLRYRAAQDVQNQEDECIAPLSRTSTASADTMFSRFMEWWAEFCSLGHKSRALLYTILFVIFLTAYLNDLPVCLAVYLLSACWWFGQGRRKRVATVDNVE